MKLTNIHISAVGGSEFFIDVNELRPCLQALMAAAIYGGLRAPGFPRFDDDLARVALAKAAAILAEQEAGS